MLRKWLTQLKRLKPWLNDIISKQSAFTVDRLITNNVLIAFESLHHMKTSYFGKKNLMALKLNISKTYDYVEWSFLEKILLKMGFQALWVSLIMECIITVSYSILVNGEPKGSCKVIPYLYTYSCFVRKISMAFLNKL